MCCNLGKVVYLKKKISNNKINIFIQMHLNILWFLKSLIMFLFLSFIAVKEYYFTILYYLFYYFKLFSIWLNYTRWYLSIDWYQNTG